jgi:restriction endonuclease Mrr
MTVLDELSGFEFEDVMEDVFRNLGYENVRQAERTADKGRDILMEETVDGQRRAVVVECKHTGSVGRPVVQKLHSAVATYDYDGPKRGMVATTGRFTGPAKAYVENLQDSDDPHQIELLDGRDLREIADEIGLDLYNGRIEILCDRTLRPYDPSRGVDAPVVDAFREVENISASEIPEPRMRAALRPFLRIRAHVDATFETSVGVIHDIDQRDTLVVRASRGRPAIPGPDVARLVASNLDQAIELDENALEERFDEVTVERFGQTETEYKEWAVDRLRREHTTTVTYTGDNNVTYTKECEPNLSDVSFRSITPVYLPQIRAQTDLGGYEYPYEYYAAGPSRRVTENGIHRCVQCGETNDETDTYCRNCDSINCTSHIEIERLVGEPVCTGCAVTERFFLKTKYFYDDENLEQFRQEYAAMPLHEKAMENKPLVAGVALTALLGFVTLLATVGIV